MSIFAQQTRPSFGQGFARSAGESAYPGLWKGLVGAWVPSLGVTGITLHDVSLRKNNGTLTNGPTWVVNEGQQALQFDTSASTYVDLGINAYDLGIRRHATFSMWCKADDEVDQRHILSDWNTSQGFAVRFSTASTIVFFVYPNNHRITVTPVVPPGVMYHIVAVMDGANMRLYLDGEFLATTTLGEDIGDSASTIKIGVRGDLDSPTTKGFEGPIWEVGIYNRALTATEIRHLFNLGRGAPFRLARNLALLSVPAAGGTILEHPGWGGGMQEYAGGMAG